MEILNFDAEYGAIIISTPANLFYLSSSNNFDAIIVLCNKKSYYITDRRYEEISLNTIKNMSVEIINPGETYLSKAVDIIKNNNLDKVSIEEEYLPVKDYIYLKNNFSTVGFISEKFIKARRTKKQLEINKIKAAQKITDEVFREFLEYIKLDVTEKDCALFIKNSFYKYGALESFDTIIAFSENSSLPHAIPSDRRLKIGDNVLIDFGAKLDGYCSDMTRTFCYKDTNEEFVKNYYMVIEAQQKAISSVKVGANCIDIDAAARNVFKNNGYDSFFKHSLGHGVGIEIHEAPYLSMKSSEVLEEGDVVTIEPGLYFDNQYGIRIEDMLFVSPNGVENLTNTTKELIIIG